jgi:uncharacterized repeat protein (TIGR02543 family)
LQEPLFIPRRIFMKRIVRFFTLLTLFALTFGAAGMMTARAAMSSPARAASTWIDPSTRLASQNFYLNQYLSSNGVDPQWNGDVAACNAGTTSAAFKTATLNRVNYYRAMAGVPDVSFSDTYSAKSQAAALMMSRNGALNHTPPVDWFCYTAEGAEGASSNLNLGSIGADAVNSFIRDAGDNNSPVGHRRWVLHPPAQQFGTGDVPASGGYPAANALWVLDNNYSPDPATRDPYVAWPPRGYVPYQVVYARWSFSYPEADFSTATVSMVSGGSNVPLTQETVAGGRGDNSIVWRPNNMASGDSWPRPASDTTYTVTVSNVLIGGSPQNFTYDVIVFNPYPSYSVSYDVNNATSGTAPASQIKEHDEPLTLATNSGLARTGYTFVGWNTQADGYGTNYAPGGTYTANASVTLYAKWTPYCVPSIPGMFDYISRVQLGTGDFSSGDEGYFNNTGPNLSDLQRGSSNSLTITAVGRLIPAAARHVLAWVDFNQDHDFADPGEAFDLGASAAANGSLTFNGSLVVPAGAALGPTYLRVAVNWGSDPTACGATYGETEDYTVTITGGGAPTYTVTYDGNGNTGGSVPTDGNTYTTGQTVTVLGNTGSLVKNGFTFAGWNTQTDGLGTDRAAGSTFAMGSANVTLYAKWTASASYCTPFAFSTYEYVTRVQLGAGDHSSVGEGYLDYTASNFTNLAAGSINPLTITATLDPIGSAEYVKAWVDFNQDGDFADPGEELDLGSSTTTGSVPFTGSLAVPAGASLGATRLRVALQWQTAPTPCNTGGSGEFEDYTVTITAGAPTYTVTYDGNSNTDGMPPTDSNNYTNGASVTVLGNTGSLVKASYNFAGWNTQADGLGTSYSPGATFTMGSANVTLYAKWLSYCTPALTADEYISRVQLNGGNQVSGRVGYEDYTASNFTTLNKGATYPIQVTGTNPNPDSYTDYVKVWVDFNQDGDFTDAGEELDLGNFNYTGDHVFSGNLAIPAGALNGTTRMRVILLWNAAPTSCVISNFGEIEDYTVTIATAPPTYTKKLQSTGAADGWVLESGLNTNKGGTMDKVTGLYLNLGDDAAKKQYRSILSFATGAAIPDNATITKVTLKFRLYKTYGTGNPVTLLGGFMADIKNGFFGTTALQLTDWQTPATKSYGPFKPNPVSGWYTLDLSAGKAYINKLTTNSGLTQIRLRFKMKYNNNSVANYITLFSGNAGAANRPQLIIEYTLP